MMGGLGKPLFWEKLLYHVWVWVICRTLIWFALYWIDAHCQLRTFRSKQTKPKHMLKGSACMKWKLHKNAKLILQQIKTLKLWGRGLRRLPVKWPRRRAADVGSRDTQEPLRTTRDPFQATSMKPRQANLWVVVAVLVVIGRSVAPHSRICPTCFPHYCPLLTAHPRERRSTNRRRLCQ